MRRASAFTAPLRLLAEVAPPASKTWGLIESSNGSTWYNDYDGASDGSILQLETLSADSVFTLPSISFGPICAALDDTYVIVVARCVTDADSVAFLVSVSGTTCTLEDRIVVDGTGSYASVARIGTDKVVIVDATGTATVVSRSGTTLSAGTAATFSARDNTSVCALDEDKFLIVGGGNGQTNLARVGTVSGTTITLGTEVTFGSSGDGRRGATVSYVSENRAVAGFAANSTTSTTVWPIGISGTTVTVGSSDTDTVGDRSSAIALTTANKLIYTSSDSGDNTYYGIPVTYTAGSPGTVAFDGGGRVAFTSDTGRLSAHTSNIVGFEDSGDYVVTPNHDRNSWNWDTIVAEFDGTMSESGDSPVTNYNYGGGPPYGAWGGGQCILDDDRIFFAFGSYITNSSNYGTSCMVLSL